MKGKLRGFLKDESGDMLIVFALLLIPALILSSFAIDLGASYASSADLQTALDAAVVAGGYHMPVSCAQTDKQAEIRAVVTEYLEKNFDGAENLEITFGNAFGGNYTQLRASAEYNQPTQLGGFTDKDIVRITRHAAVQTAVCVALTDVVPLSVSQKNLDACLASGALSHITLKYGAGDGTGGNYGAIDLDGVKGGGANDYRNWLANGYDGLLSVSETLLPVESGNMAGPTTTAITQRYNACTHYASDGGCTLEHYEPGCPRVLKVPVVVYDGNKNAKIVGFAAFILEEPASSDKGTVTGSYVDMVTVGSFSADQTGTAADYGVYSLILTE